MFSKHFRDAVATADESAASHAKPARPKGRKALMRSFRNTPPVAANENDGGSPADARPKFARSIEWCAERAGPGI